ncbi:hypothetical protein [Streptomyces sp. NPDC057428]|uniref:hypothetical protein n=1 Tax=Streptomyces sp. NPDC057428 TaxID=3346129 RepID=UPI0036B2DD0F
MASISWSTQQGQFAQLAGDHPDVGAVLDEVDAPVADGIGQTWSGISRPRGGTANGPVAARRSPVVQRPA